ncbi:MAG: hypothetical protein FJ253_11015 [Phycisphaerae bacterium]|nr:hypothetical protein [Phycisphaerae bacterium]
MTTLVLPRLYSGWWPLLRAFGVVCTAIGFGLLASMARSAIWPVALGADADAWISGSIVYLAAGVVAALLAGGAWELRVSSFAWNTPELSRRLRREMAVGGFIVFGIGAGVGASIHGALTGASWFLAVAAALGFSIGLVNSLSRLMWARFGGTLGIVLAVLPLFFMSEIARLISNGGFLGGLLCAMLSAGVVMVATDRLGRVLERRGDAPDPSEDRGLAARFGGTATLAHRAPRDGADGFRGVRRSNLDWARALLHETYGVARGGLVGRTIRFSLATMLITVLVRGFFRALGKLRVTDATTGAAPTPETTSFTAVQQGLSGFSLEWFIQPLASRKEELTVSVVVATALVAVIWNGMASSSALNYPISRRRLAWVGWLRTQLEEGAVIAGMLVGFAALGLAESRLGGGDAWASMIPFVTVTIVVFTLLPVVRWMRLWLVDARRPTRRLDAASESQDPSILITYALSICVIVFGAFLLPNWWREGARHIRGELPEALHAWIPLLALVPIVLLRWLWLVELRRYYRRSDLA